MAFDKVVDSAKLDATFTAIADAIREKKGSTDVLTPEQMAVEIEGIVTGDDLPNAEDSAFGDADTGIEYGITTTGTAKNSVDSMSLGWNFVVAEAFQILGLRHYHSYAAANGYDKHLKLWDSSGNLLRSVSTKEYSTDGKWVDCYFDEPLNASVGESFTVTIYTRYTMYLEGSTFNAKVRSVEARYHGNDEFPTSAAGVSGVGAVDIIIGQISAELPKTHKIARTTMDDIANEVKRISGIAGKMSTAQIITELSNTASAGTGGDTGYEKLLYELPETTVFNGTSDFIDTGVQLLKEKREFTILADFASKLEAIRAVALFHCMKEISPYPGFVMQNSTYTSHQNEWAITLYGEVYYAAMSPVSTDRYRIVICGNTIPDLGPIYAGNLSGGYKYVSTGQINSSTNSYTPVDETLLIGAYQSSTGTKGRFFKGTIYDFKVLGRAVGQFERDAYLQTGTLDY